MSLADGQSASATPVGLDLTDRERASKYFQLPQILQRRDGSMTRELLLRPGDHGLGMTPETLQADKTTTATCGFCATGCGLRLHIRDGHAVGLTPETAYPVNLGMACPKGWEALRVLESDDRATQPLLRQADGEMKPVDWDTALKTFCERFKQVQEFNGPESVAFLSTGQIPCEEMAFLGSLAKFGMGIVHGDGNTRQCMATAVTAYKQSFGFDAPPYTYDDFEQSDCMVFVGANPCIGHPIMWERVLRNKKSPEIIVLDPRRTETAMAATEHVALRPKNDLRVLYAITNELIQRGFTDQQFIEQHTVGFEELRQHVASFSVDAVAEEAGLEPDQLRRVAEKIGRAEATSLWWTMGVNQSYEGVRTAQAIINIALITGNIGRPGTGANSITGQCNAMGSRLWSNTTNLLGHRQFQNEQHRREVADILGIDVDRIPTQDSWSYDRIIEGIERGEIRGLWVIATNPAHSWIDQDHTRDLLDRLDFLVVQDMYHTAHTVRHADLVLPAAGWSEKEGTFINSERRYGLVKKVRTSPGLALADFQIFRGVAHYWGVGDMFARWTTPESVFESMQQLSAGRPCDITGIEGYEHIDRCGGIQWPWSHEDANGFDPEQQRRLFADGGFFHADGRARLIVDQITDVPEEPDQEFPFWLMTGRGTVSQWHTQTRTSKSPVLRQLYPNEAYIEINPVDANEMDVLNGDRLAIRSRRGSAEAVAFLSSAVPAGHAFMPMHYEQTNCLTLSHFDPHSRQPSYKDCAVTIQPA